MFAQGSVMEIQKIKELALANGFSLKEQASGNMDLHSYVYEFANAIEQAVKAQAVPEGFVLVPMVPSERMINAVRHCYEGEAYLPYSLYSEFVNQAIIERMEAQEPTND